MPLVFTHPAGEGDYLFRPDPQTPWRDLPVRRVGSRLHAEIELPAGGWYRGEIEKRGQVASVPLLVGPFGIGEVYLIAGQSYATNRNETHLRVLDPEGRVTALDPVGGAWRTGHDPQPAVAEETGTGGTIWPTAMDHLVHAARVPVGMANVAVSATASSAWTPGSPLHANLVRAAGMVGDYRAVLWQQGESDVIEGTPGVVWVERVRAMRSALVDATGRERPWIVARSTLHPTVYDLPEARNTIRDAVAVLTRLPGFVAGPDTDTLAGAHRAPAEAQGHFSRMGQLAAGRMWFEVLWRELCSWRTASGS